MGLGGISIWQLLIILVIVLVLFGSKRVKSIGSDLGEAIKGFKKSMADENERLEDRHTTEAHQRTVAEDAEKIKQDQRP